VALTAKQEAFAAAVAKGTTGADAYRGAYDARNMRAETLHKRVGELLKHGGIAGRIAELRAPALRRHQVSADKTMDEIATAAYGEVSEQLPWSAKLKALEMLARMGGLFEKDSRQQAQNLAIQINFVEAKTAPC
jgi:hypothetical protein